MSQRAQRWISILLSFVALAASGLTLFVERTAGAQDAPMKVQLAAVEARQESYAREIAALNLRLVRIEDKLDRALERRGGWRDNGGGGR